MNYNGELISKEQLNKVGYNRIEDLQPVTKVMSLTKQRLNW